MARIVGANGNDNRAGTANADTFEMNGGNDVAHGGGGNDIIHGGAGADTLFGEGGNDTLTGGAGRDVLVGSAGADQLRGGDGADSFSFRSVNTGDGINSIMDFSRAEGDRIDLSNIDANHNVAGNQAFAFIGGQAFSGHAGEVRAYSIDLTGRGDYVTFINMDVDGDRQSDQTVGMSGAYSLFSSDFVL